MPFCGAGNWQNCDPFSRIHSCPHDIVVLLCGLEVLKIQQCYLKLLYEPFTSSPTITKSLRIQCREPVKKELGFERFNELTVCVLSSRKHLAVTLVFNKTLLTMRHTAFASKLGAQRKRASILRNDPARGKTSRTQPRYNGHTISDVQG